MLVGEGTLKGARKLFYKFEIKVLEISERLRAIKGNKHESAIKRILNVPNCPRKHGIFTLLKLHDIKELYV